jgi:hypothetical protein
MGEKTIKLPTQKVKASHVSPNNLIIFAKPKVGKTSLLAELPDCLILDTESGSDYVDALKMKVTSVEDIKEIGKAIIDAGHPYKYIAVDTITALENICMPYAEVLYSRTPMGKNWFKKSPDGNYDPTSGKAMYGIITQLPNGAGWQYQREAMTKVIEYIKTLAPRIILVGHVKETLLEKNGTEFNSSDLDLTGKFKRIISSQSDAIGYLYRKGDTNILSFKTTDEVSCGARPNHLKNAEIEISKWKNDKLTTSWEKVYID